MGGHKEWSRVVALLKSAILLAAGCCSDRAVNIVWKSDLLLSWLAVQMDDEPHVMDGIEKRSAGESRSLNGILMRFKAREKIGSQRRKSSIDSFFVISLLLSFVFFNDNLFSKRCIYSSLTRILTNSIAQYSISNESDFTQTTPNRS